MKLLIAGSRDFEDYSLLKERVSDIIQHLDINEVTIISGTARGADRLGEKYADDHAINLERYPADWNKFGRSAGIKRNIEMGKVCTHAIIFWDGKSRGTRHMIDEMTAQGKPFEVVYYNEFK